MFKKVLSLVLAVSMVLAVSAIVFANEGVRLDVDSPDPLPLRAAAEAIGATVGWLDESRTVVVSKDELVLHIQVDQPLPNNFGAVTFVNDRVFVPAAFIAQTFGVQIRWDEESQAVYVYEAVEAEATTVEYEEVEVEETEVLEPVEEVEYDYEEEVVEAEEYDTVAPTAADLLALTDAAILEAGSALMAMTVHMDMHLDGELLANIESTTTVAMVVRSETDFDMRTVASMKMGDELEMTTVSYLRNGYLYTDVLGVQTRVAMPLDQFDILDQVGVSDLTDELIIQQRVAADESYVVLVLSGETMSDAVDELTGGIMEGLGISMTISDIELRITLDEDGLVDVMYMTFSITAGDDDMMLVIYADIVSEFTQIGGVEIVFPAELDDFELVG